MESKQTLAFKRKVADYCVILIIYLITFGIMLAYNDSRIGSAKGNIKTKSSLTAPSVTNSSVKGTPINNHTD